jgi:hypothetical protein
VIEVEALLAEAVKHFWDTRSNQKINQGSTSGQKDAGNRAAVTGGKHADGFVNLIAAILRDAGLSTYEIFTTEKPPRTLPGFFRPTKEWDLVVLHGSDLVAAVEVKSQVGSFGNNFNNRVEEALGNATDFWTAYKKGTFNPSAKPWLGYLFMLEEEPVSIRSRKRINLRPHHFKVDEAFQEKSYAQCYEEVCKRLVREMLYDSACFFTSSYEMGVKGEFSQPNPELSIRNFAVSLHSRAAAFANLKPR